jgi:hypothetical protein
MRSRRTSSPGLFVAEPLEDRRLFTVTIGMPAPDTLTFTGDADDDVIIIKDNGSFTVGGQVSGTAGTLIPFGPVSGIHRVLIATDGGDDRVYYTVAGDMFLGGLHGVSASLGTGNDVFAYYAGNDIDVGFNDIAVVLAGGGDQDDTLAYFHRGEIDGQVYVGLAGGNGSDRVSIDEKTDAGSQGKFFARARGDAGRDNVDLLVRKGAAVDSIAIDAFADSGGADGAFDQLTRTALASDDALFDVVNVLP